MGHTPYGYRIENGTAVIVEKEAACIRRIFRNYIDGMSLREAAKTAGHPIVHSMVKRLLSRTCYCGNEFYPAIIDEATFREANEELHRRAASSKQTGKTYRSVPKPQTEFSMAAPVMHYDDPYEQAEYLYSLIESKVVECPK